MVIDAGVFGNVGGEEFKNGKYTDNIRMLCQDLLCIGASANMVSSVVKKVMEN